MRVKSDTILGKILNRTDYETRCNIESFLKSKSIEFLLWSMERFTYHLNFGFRDKAGKSWTPDEIYTDFILTN